MFLERSQKNRLSVGKQLRGLKGLRRKDGSALRIAPSPALEEYKADLLSRGMEVGPLELGLFETRNGLKYPGFIATEDIGANSILLRVPVGCLLTTRDAFVSEIRSVFEQNPQFFAKAFSSDWEDRILLTYLLFENQKGAKSQWHHLLRNLPREIDYVVFWEDKELEQLEDSWIHHSIRKEKAKVRAEQDELLEIAARYPQFFEMGTFTRGNMEWIHTHLVTRCFGKYFEYTTMVPYAELFNHECVDVYYTMDYRPDSPHNPHELLDPPRTLSQQDQDEADTSEGSYEASDVSAEDADYQEMQLDEQLVSKCSTATEGEIRSINSYLISFINFNDSVSLSYLGQVQSVLEELRMSTLPRPQELEITQRVHSHNVKYLKLVKEFYYKLGSKAYSYGLKQKKKYKEAQKKEQMVVDPSVDYFEGAWPVDKFDDFLMVCGSKDQFQAGSQVYFCYGRLPNRLLLMRYGIALEHNKYNHFFLRRDSTPIIQSSPPLCRIVQQELALKKYRNFKIKRTLFCTELVTFFRALAWRYTPEADPQHIFYVVNTVTERAALKRTQDCLNDRLMEFETDLSFNEAKLTDQQLTYHQYFALVYKVEQQRIIAEQLEMIGYALAVLEELEKGDSLETVLRGEKSEQRLRWQIMMATYFNYYKL